MDQLENGLDISINGPRREEALRRFYGTIETWGIALPEVTPLVLDFGLNEFERVGLIEFWIANEIEAGYCAKYLFVFDGQTCPMHRHRVKQETFFVVRGALRVTYGDEQLSLQPGQALRIEPWVYHDFTGDGPCLMLEISRPCIVSDNYFQNERIPIGGNFRPGSVASCTLD